MGRKARTKRERRSQGQNGPAPQSQQRKLRKWLPGIFLSLLILAGAGWWWNGSFDALELMLEPAPAFALPASTGGTVRLEDYLGKQELVLFFYMFAR